jgi:hypothetical protein
VSESNVRAGWIFGAALALALGGAGAWSGSTLSDAKQAAADAAADTAACRRLAEQITAARSWPATSRPAGDDIGPRLERAMAAADVDAEALARVAPQPPRPVGQTGTAVRSTQVALQRITLKQALAFVANLVGERRGGLTLESFDLTVPTAEPGGVAVNGPGDTGTEWDVDLSVSQVVKVSR